MHCYVTHYLRKQIKNLLYGRKDKQEKLLGRLQREFDGCAQRYGLSRGDFPDPRGLHRQLVPIKDWSKHFSKLDKRLVGEMDGMFAYDIPKLLEKAASAPRAQQGAGGEHPATGL